MVSRREFIRKAGFAAAAVSIPGSLLKSNDITTGISLYTVRAEMEKDQYATLKYVAETGYSWVEAANYTEGLFYNQKPVDFRRRVEYHGLKLISSHMGATPANIDRAVSDCADAGVTYLVLPSLPPEWRKYPDGYKEAAHFFNVAGEKCKKSGLKFCFHNHRNEFKRSRGFIPFDLLVNETDRSLVSFELDLCWITAGKQSATDYINKFPGRFELFHLKDMSADKNDATLGEGVIDFRKIFDMSGKAGMRYFFVEQDNFRTHTPFESIKISHDYILKNLSGYTIKNQQ
jgi:sugar phosphate isomerase/epimerase